MQFSCILKSILKNKIIWQPEAKKKYIYFFSELKIIEDSKATKKRTKSIIRDMFFCFVVANKLFVLLHWAKEAETEKEKEKHRRKKNFYFHF